MTCPYGHVKRVERYCNECKRLSNAKYRKKVADLKVIRAAFNQGYERFANNA